MYLLKRGRRWVEARTSEVAGELGMSDVRGQWQGEFEPVYLVRFGSTEQSLVFSPVWLVYCSYDMSEPLRGLIMIEIRSKLAALKRRCGTGGTVEQKKSSANPDGSRNDRVAPVDVAPFSR
jgi:hypothetical protein